MKDTDRLLELIERWPYLPWWKREWIVWIVFRATWKIKLKKWLGV